VPETVDSNSGFKDYEIISLLGEGATSKVMKVREKSSGKLFAMKIMYKERKVLVNNHPFLVALHSCFQTRRKIYLGTSQVCLKMFIDNRN
jgi:serine/threonine protein kinase